MEIRTRNGGSAAGRGGWIQGQVELAGVYRGGGSTVERAGEKRRGLQDSASINDCLKKRNEGREERQES